MSEFDVDPFAELPPTPGLSAEERAALESVLVANVSDLKVKIPNVPDLSDLIPGTNLPRFARNRPAPPLEEYVAEQVEAVRRLVGNGLKNPVHQGEDRVVRAERYARWRWHGFIDGEIARL